MDPRILHIEQNGSAGGIMQAYPRQFLKAFESIGFHSHLQLSNSPERSKHLANDPIPIIGHFPSSLILGSPYHFENSRLRHVACP